MEPGLHRTQRAYVVLGGELPLVCDEWAIATLDPGITPEEFHGANAMITTFLEARGWRISYTSRCGMGSVLIQFTTACSRDTAISQSPFQIGDTTLRISRHDRGLNYHSITFTHDVWLLLMNYPLECWEVGVISHTVSPFGRFLIWNKDPRDKTRIVVKIRAYNVDTLPVSIVVLHNLDDVGYGDSWTCPTYILSREIIGQQGDDEDPLPPNGGNPHPMPHVHDGFWHDEVLGNIPAEQVVFGVHNENLGAANVDVHAVGASVDNPGNINNNQSGSLNLDAENQNAAIDLNVAEPSDAVNEISHHVEAHNTVVSNAELSHDSSFIPVPQVESADTLPDNVTQDLQVDMQDQIAALKGLIGNLFTNADDIIPKLGGAKIIGAQCNIVDVVGTNGTNKRCFLQVQTVQETSHTTSSASLKEITQDEFAETVKPTIMQNKRKKRAPVDEALCYRSDRIAKFNMGYKDKTAAKTVNEQVEKLKNVVAGSSNVGDKYGNKKPGIAVNLGPKFDAIVIDKGAAPPPSLPIETIQAIGKGPCKMAPGEVSSQALQYDSSDE